jgi:hypothetical protein
MISSDNLEVLAHKLHVYDIDQGAWEQEGNGFEANARHVLTHLAKDVVTKDFSDEDLVRGAIAPDSIQYALRLSRWAGVETDEILELTQKEEDIRDTAEDGLRDLPWGYASFAGAVGVLAGNLHDLDHASARDGAVRGTHKAMRSASRLLLNSASIQSYQYGFSITEAFDNRIAVLRRRFSIPEPTERS